MSESWFRLYEAFKDPDRSSRQTVYVYRLGTNGLSRKPYVLKACGFFFSDTELLSYLQQEYGGGDYRVLIRDGSTMTFTGDVSIAAPI